MVRRNVKNSAFQVEIAPKGAWDRFRATGYSVSSDAEFVAYRNNVQKVRVELFICESFYEVPDNKKMNQNNNFNIYDCIIIAFHYTSQC